MARIQAYVSKEAVEKIHVIVEQRRQEGAAETEVSTSSVISMLLELGLRVYEAQMERKDEPFNQTEFNRVLLENVLKTQLAMAKVLGASTLAPYVSDKPKLNNYQQIIHEIKEAVKEDIGRFFMMEMMTSFVSLMYLSIAKSAGDTLYYSRCSLRYRATQTVILTYDYFLLMSYIYLLANHTEAKVSGMHIIRLNKTLNS